MRSRRILEVNGIYHVMSRVVNGEGLFGEGEREVMGRMLEAVAEFSGVEVLTWCVMSNHFHILVRVPEQGELSDEELLRRYTVLHGISLGWKREGDALKYAPESPEVVEARLEAGGAMREEERGRLLARMNDLSEFMKTFKQRVAIWANAQQGRYGPLWAERFKSVLVEGRGNVLLVMAAYIDLNAVRAGLVEDPVEYRHCGYAMAMGGRRWARAGLARVVGLERRAGQSEEAYWGEVLGQYRALLLSVGSAAREGKGEVDPGLVRAVVEGKSMVLSRHELLACRLRYLVQGALLGSRGWVEARLSGLQEQYYRKTPAQGKDLPGLGMMAGKACRK